MDKAIQLEKVKTYLSFFPQFVDMKELAVQTAIKLGDDPMKIFPAEMFQPGNQNQPPQPGQAQPGQLGQPGQQVPPNGLQQPEPIAPQGNVAGNAVQGLKNAKSLQTLSKTMTRKR